MMRLVMVLLIALSASSCLTILSGGEPTSEISVRTDASDITVELLASGALVESCQAPCTLAPRMAKEYVVRFVKPGLSSESVLINFVANQSGTVFLINLPTLFVGFIVDAVSGAAFVYDPAIIVVRERNGSLKAYRADDGSR